MKTVRAPQSDYSGVSAGVSFTDGIGYTDDDNALAYFRASGYEVTNGGTPPEEIPQSVRPRANAAPPSRDASVVPNAGGPLSDAFLPPVNAGGGDPHGPVVVSPGLHAVPPAPIVPGPVRSEPAEQERVETEAATAVLVNGEPVATGTADVQGGPLNLSDVASVGEGPDAAVTESEAPAKSAPKSEWVDYAVSQGMTRDDAEASTKADLTDRYG